VLFFEDKKNPNKLGGFPPKLGGGITLLGFLQDFSALKNPQLVLENKK
jgi:hypothetical protein